MSPAFGGQKSHGKLVLHQCIIAPINTATKPNLELTYKPIFKCYESFTSLNNFHRHHVEIRI